MEQPTTQLMRILAERISRSDREAFDSLFRTFYSRLVHFACNYVPDKDEACDIVQDVFVKLWMNRHEIDPDRSLKAFLYKMVCNRSLNYKRDYSGKRTRLELLNGRESSAEDPVFQDESPDLGEKFKEWIEEMPDRRRQAFELSRFEGLDHEEIAQIMNITAKTVNNQIVAALKVLRDRYAAYQREVDLF